MTDEPSAKVSCYSEGEGKFMQQSQALRARFLLPLLRGMDRVGLSPNHLTLLSLVTGILFCPLFFWKYYGSAFALLLLHVLLDGLDGPLARYQDRASSRGSFTDTSADQVVVALTTITLIYTGHAGAWPGGLYLFTYSMVVVFAMVRSALAIPYAWLVRPRFIVYVGFLVEVYGWPGTLNPVLWFFTALLTLKMLSGFVRIRRRL